MNSRRDSIERHGGTGLKLIDSIGLLGPRELVSCNAPGKAAGQTEALGFREKRFTPPERRLALSTFDGDARDV